MEQQELNQQKPEKVVIVQSSPVAGILAIVFGALSIFIFPIVFVPLGIIFGVIALTKKQPLSGALGLVLSAIGLLTALIVFNSIVSSLSPNLP